MEGVTEVGCICNVMLNISRHIAFGSLSRCENTIVEYKAVR